jgi:hypothetical protein
MSSGSHADDDRSVDALPALTAREVCQVLREVTFERCAMRAVSGLPLEETRASTVVVDVEGWRITLHTDANRPTYCEACVNPQGRRWSFKPGDRSGTDPVALLSTWECATLGRILQSL